MPVAVTGAAGGGGGAEDLLGVAKALSERVAAHHRRVRAEGDGLAAEVKALLERLGDRQQALRAKRRGARAGAAGAPSLGDVAVAQKALDQVRRVIEGNGPGEDLRFVGGQDLVRQKPSLLAYLCGTSARLAAARPDLRMKLKEDYYSFRDTTTLIFILTPLVLLLGMWRADSIVKNQSGAHTFSPVLSAAVQCYIAWIIYFYTAVALRENILVVNGSNIRTWWMQHHYISIFMGLLMLTMPVESEAFKKFGKRMMVFNLLQGLVMFMQTHYQRKRLYTRIAMGKSSKMDVATADSSAGTGQLLILYPVLFLLQAFQFYMGMVMIVYHAGDMFTAIGFLDEFEKSSDLRSSRTVFVCGVLFLLLASGNFGSTVATLRAKRKKSHQRALLAEESPRPAEKAD